MKNYTDLPIELTVKIADHVDFHQDFENFGLVCTNWRRAMKLTSRFTTSHQTPWLMIPTPMNFSKARFYRVYDHSIRHVNLPFVGNDNDNDNIDESENMYYKIPWCRHVYSSRGWLIFLDDFGATRKDISLMHPFTRERIRINTSLPKDMMSRELCEYCSDYKDAFAYIYDDSIFALSHHPNSSTSSHYTLAVIFIKSCNKVYTAGFWNSKDEKWVVITTLPYLEDVTDITFYKGEFYVVDNQGRMIVSNGFDDTVRPLITKPNWVMESSNGWEDKVYLVESAGVLLQVFRSYVFSDKVSERVTRFKVKEVNVYNGESKELKSLGNRALFVGPNSCFSMEASSHGCKANCIYYVNDLRLYEHFVMGVYDLTSGQKIEDHVEPTLLAKSSKLFWVEAPPNNNNNNNNNNI